MSSLFDSPSTARDLNRPSLTVSQNSFSRPLRAKRPPTENYPRSFFEPLIVASKPIHSPTDKTNPPIISRIKPPATAPSRSRANFVIAQSLEEKPPELPIADNFNDDNPSRSSTPTPPRIKREQENISRKIVTSSITRMRPPSSNPVTSTIKLRSKTPRCRSATETKPSYIANKNYPRFIIIADEDHRIESWYHQYPFLLGDDLITSFESNQSQPKPTISGYFIDDLQTSNPNITAKTFLQGKPFNVTNDWKKYDLVFISNNIYEQIMIHFKKIINLMKSSGKIIKIYQIQHDGDLKKQVRNICKQVQQQNI